LLLADLNGDAEELPAQFLLVLPADDLVAAIAAGDRVARLEPREAGPVDGRVDRPELGVQVERAVRRRRAGQTEAIGDALPQLHAEARRLAARRLDPV